MTSTHAAEPLNDDAGQRRPGRSASLSAEGDTALLASILRPTTDLRGCAEATRLLAAFGDLASVVAADAAALERAGLDAEAAAALGRARRLAAILARVEACRRPVLSSWSALTAYLRVELAHASREQFRVLYLDKRNILMREEHRAEGTTDHAPVYVREVVRRALELAASALILVHNHPSGDPQPSQADIAMTRRVVDAARLFDIAVHDHLVVGREGTASFRQLGLLS